MRGAAGKIYRRCRSFLESYADHMVLAGSDSEWDSFYNRFEAKFRGSDDLIADRLAERYRQRLQSVREKSKAFTNGMFVDLGCGRGEMLSLAASVGFQTRGVDQSYAAVQEVEKIGLIAETGDILRFLSKQPDESIVAASCLHVVEHCPESYCWKLFREVYRVLKPGGIFVVETPSLFSLWAGHRQFYLDPTHVRPVHPEYLQFLAEDNGFSSSEVLEFDEVKSQERAQLAEVSEGKLADQLELLEKWLYGPMDVACWATK